MKIYTQEKCLCALAVGLEAQKILRKEFAKYTSSSNFVVDNTRE